MSRRSLAGAAVLLGAALAGTPPAHAFLGFGDDPKVAAEQYAKDTVSEWENWLSWVVKHAQLRT